MSKAFDEFLQMQKYMKHVYEMYYNEITTRLYFRLKGSNADFEVVEDRNIKDFFVEIWNEGYRCPKNRILNFIGSKEM